ncbi:MAG: hypothetical protein P8Y13_08530 [Deinococcales bacterium]
MPLSHALEARRFSNAGPVPQPLSVGEGLAAMLLCLQRGQRLQAPESDEAETVFTVLAGVGAVIDGEERFEVRAGDVVHVLPGRVKALEAGDGTFTVLGVRRLGGRRG